MGTSRELDEMMVCDCVYDKRRSLSLQAGIEQEGKKREADEVDVLCVFFRGCRCGTLWEGFGLY
jgi:hypothetical protein